MGWLKLSLRGEGGWIKINEFISCCVRVSQNVFLKLLSDIERLTTAQPKNNMFLQVSSRCRNTLLLVMTWWLSQRYTNLN